MAEQSLYNALSNYNKMIKNPIKLQESSGLSGKMTHDPPGL